MTTPSQRKVNYAKIAHMENSLVKAEVIQDE